MSKVGDNEPNGYCDKNKGDGLQEGIYCKSRIGVFVGIKIQQIYYSKYRRQNKERKCNKQKNRFRVIPSYLGMNTYKRGHCLKFNFRGNVQLFPSGSTKVKHRLGGKTKHSCKNVVGKFLNGNIEFFGS